MASGKNTAAGPAVAAPDFTNGRVIEQQSAIPDNQPIRLLRVLFARVFWCFAGPSLLAMWAIRIATKHDGWFAPLDIGFLASLALVIGARWYCFSANDYTDAQGNVSSIRQLRDYTRHWIIGGVLVWIAANLIGNVVY